MSLWCSEALKKLVAMVGTSFSIYQGIADLCTAKYRDSEGVYVGLKEAAYCSLRCQLLMSLHDNGANELCAQVQLFFLSSFHSLVIPWLPVTLLAKRL